MKIKTQKYFKKLRIKLFIPNFNNNIFRKDNLNVIRKFFSKLNKNDILIKDILKYSNSNKTINNNNVTKNENNFGLFSKIFYYKFQFFNKNQNFIRIKIRWILFVFILFIINYGFPKNILSKYLIYIYISRLS